MHAVSVRPHTRNEALPVPISLGRLISAPGKTGV